jgi:hypothetical protein
MTLLNIIVYTVGFAVCVWWVIGVILFAWGAKVYVGPQAPLFTKIMTVLTMGFVMPWHMLKFGTWPRVALVPNNNPAAMRDYENWLMEQCGCEGCQKELERRGL